MASQAANCEGVGLPAARVVRIVPPGSLDAAPTDEEAAAFLEDDTDMEGGRAGWHAGGWSSGGAACLIILGISALLLVFDNTTGATWGQAADTHMRSRHTVELHGEGCHTTVDGEECYTLVSWIVQVAMRDGSTDFAGLGITSSSSREDVQEALHHSDDQSVCPQPCTGGDGIGTVEDAAVASAKSSTSHVGSIVTTTTTFTIDKQYQIDRVRETAIALAHPTQEPHALAAEGGFPSKAALAYKAAEQKAMEAHALTKPGDHAPAAVSASGCGIVEDMVYLPGNDLHTIPNVSRPEDCCEACSRDAACVAWTWGRRLGESVSVLPHGAHMCYLKGSKPRGVLTRVRDPDFTSGWTIPSVKPGSIITDWPTGRDSLLCASTLSAPGLDEEAGAELLALQYSMQAGVFACDEYILFCAPDGQREIAPGVWSVPLVEPEGHRRGGWARSGGKEVDERLSLLDSKLLFWRVLIQSNRHRFHDWTLKIDPQAVFFPSRLRMRIRHVDEQPDGTYMSACNQRASHTLEVLSRKAVDSWSLGWERCLDYLALQPSTNQSGEAELLDQCLTMLNIRREADPQRALLSSADCGDQTHSCSNVSIAAFHPFGTEESYRRCFEESQP